MDKAVNHQTITTPWLTTAEACDYAKIHRNTLEKWRAWGLPHKLVGGCYRYHRDELDAFIHKHDARKVARRHGRRA